MDNIVIAANLKRLRTAKEMSQKALAGASGVSLPAIKNIEGGKSVPRTHTLMKLTKVLDTRFQELFMPVRTLEHVRFRSRKRVAAREQILSRVARWLYDFNSLEEILSDTHPYHLADVPATLGNNEPMALAAAVRRTMGLSSAEPIRDMCGLLEHAGIKVLPLLHSSDAFFGLSVGEKDKGPAVIVNIWDRISTERQIFSAAHELGHLLMHISAYSKDTTYEEKEQEREADLFAEHFLMHEEGFARAWDEASGLHFLDRVMKVKRMFKVSYKTVLFRLIQRGVLDDSMWRKFPPAFERHYGRKLSRKEEPFSEGAEPFGMQYFDFYEDRLSRLIRKAIESDEISLSRGAEILHISTEDMMNRIREWQELA